MPRCLSRFVWPIFLTYLGFLLLGSLVGLTIGLLLAVSLATSVIIGFFIGLALAIIANAIIIIVANKTCFHRDRDSDDCN